MADRYWVNGTGNWNDTAKWSASSGGASGASVPTTADNVFFDNNSGTVAGVPGIFTVTITANSACANFDASGITDAARKMTLTGTSGNILNVAGSWVNPTGSFYASTFASPILFSATTTGQTITTNGVVFSSTSNQNVTFNGVGGEWTLGSAFTLSGASSSTTLTNGALNLGNFTLTTGYWSSNNSNTRSIAFGTTGSISVYTTAGGAVWGMATVTGFSYTGNSSVLISGSPATTHGSTAGGTEANSLNFTYTGSTSGTTTTNTRYRNLTFSAYSGTFTGGVIIYGDLVASPTMTFGTTVNATSFSGSGVQTITMNGKAFSQSLTFNGTGTVTLIDNLSYGAYSFNLTSGTVNINGKTVSGNAFSSTGTTARVLNFGLSGVMNLASSGNVWNATGSGLTTSGTGTISMTSASAKTFVGGGYNYAATLDQGGAGTLTISGSNTFQNITNTYGATGATTITFTASTTQTVSAFTASGTSGNQLTLNSSTAGTRFNLSDASGVVSVSFCNIQDSNATGGATWKAATASGNVSVSNNAGWNFGQYYWVGGSGTWNNTNAVNWSTSSGGAGGSGPPTITDTVVFDTNSGTGTCTTAATTAGYDILFNSDTLGLTLGAGLTISGPFTLSQGAINLAGFQLSCLNFLSNNANTRSILFGTGNITVTGNGTVWNTSTVTNFSYTGTPTINISNNSATATTVTTGSMSEAQALDFNYTTGTYALTDTSAVYRNLSFTGFAGTVPNSARTLYGNLTLAAGPTYTAGTNATTFSATSGTQTVTTNSQTLDYPVTQNNPGATLSLQDNFTLGSTRAYTLTAGTFNVNGKTASVGTFASTGSTTRSITFGTSGNITVVGSGATAWNASGSGLTTTGTTSTISMISASAKTFVGGGFNYAATLDQGGAGTLTISGSNTFQNITNTYGATGATTITFTAGTTQTVSAFTASGTSGNILTLNSSSAGTRFNLSDASGTVSVSYSNIKDSNATGGARWNSYLSNGNINAGNNLGWDFSQRGGLSPVPGLSGANGLSLGVGLVGNL